MDRRTFLRSGTTAALVLGSGLASTPGRTKRISRAEGAARNIIFLVVDGMSMATLTAADELRRMRGQADALHWIQLYNDARVRTGFMDVRPRNAIVTDSAAAGSAWGCGVSVNVRSINTAPDGEPYAPMCHIFQEQGKKTGLVSTARLTHATPASFAATVPHRNQEDTIAEQYVDRSVDVLLGGGNLHFAADHREDGVDMYRVYQQAGYTVVRRRQDLHAVRGTGPLLGVFSDGHLPYSLDRMNTPELEAQVPTLPEMTSIALARLNEHPDGFLLQVEGARVDHGAHGNDAGAMLYDQLAFDETIGTVLRFVESRSDTLVIITTDHGTGNPALNRSMRGYPATLEEYERVAQLRYTNDWVLQGLSANSSVDAIRERVETATRVGLSLTEGERLQAALQGNHDATYRMMSPPDATLGAIMANYTSIGWTGTSHTTDYAPVLALGPGSELLQGFGRNTNLFWLMCGAAGVTDAVPTRQRQAATAAG